MWIEVEIHTKGENTNKSKHFEQTIMFLIKVITFLKSDTFTY